MKKIFMLIAMVMVCVMSYAQLQTKTVKEACNYESVYTFWMGYGEIGYFNKSYILYGASTNQYESQRHSIYLGSTKAEAIQSLKDLKFLKDNRSDDVFVPSGLKGRETAIIDHGRVFGTEGVAGLCYALQWLKTDKAIKAIEDF